MPSDIHPLTETGVVLIAAYLLHSTLWLLAAWMLATTLGHRSAMLRERLWRCAALLPFVTLSAQFLRAGDHAAWTWTISPAVTSSVDSEQPESQPPLLEITEPEPHPVAWFSPSFPSSGLGTHFPETPFREPPHGVVPSSGGRDTELPPSFPNSTPSFPSSGLGTQLPETPFREPSHSVDPSNEGQETEFLESAFPSRSLGTRAEEGLGTRAGESLGTREAAVTTESAKAETLPTSTLPLVEWAIRAIVAAVGLWIFVGLLRVAWIAMRTIVRVRRLTAMTDGPAPELLCELRESHGIRRAVRLVTADRACEPAALGLWRWTILLPAGIETRLDRPQLRALLAHELAHLVRGDVWWLWIGRTLTASCGWQPLNRLAVRRWREASEQLCDDWAVSRGVEPLTLAHCLTSVAEWRLNTACPAGGLTVIGRRRRLTSRIQRLTGPRPPDRWGTPARRRLFTVGLLLAAAVLSYTVPRIVWAVPAKEPVPPSFPNSSLGTPLPEAPLREPSPGVGRAHSGRETEFLESAFPSRSLGTREDSLNDDLAALRRDLRHALSLLAETEADPEITVLVKQIRRRIDTLDVPPEEADR